MTGFLTFLALALGGALSWASFRRMRAEQVARVAVLRRRLGLEG